MASFKLTSKYQPTGDQPEAIRQLTDGLERGDQAQVLLGVTGSGKTFTIANVIANAGRPTLILSHNKTLAAQLYEEMRGFFPENAVEYYVSYYDYYQPEAYVPQSDTYIEKDASINEEVEKLRHQATSSLLSRRDVIVVASVSCIYGIGSPEDYAGLAPTVSKDVPLERDELAALLLDLLSRVSGSSHFVYWQVTRGFQGVRSHAYDSSVPGKLWVLVSPEDLEDPKVPLRLITLEDRRFEYGNIKTLNLLPAVLYSTEATRAGADEAVLHRNGIRVILSGVNERVHEVLLKNGFRELLGEENICPNINRALELARK